MVEELEVGAGEAARLLAVRPEECRIGPIPQARLQGRAGGGHGIGVEKGGKETG